MQISLLNQDSERMMKKLEDLEKRMYEDTSEGTDLQE